MEQQSLSDNDRLLLLDMETDFTLTTAAVMSEIHTCLAACNQSSGLITETSFVEDNDNL